MWYSNSTDNDSTFGTKVDNDDSLAEESLAAYYSTVVPIMLAMCFMSFVTNFMIMVSVGWIRRTLSPTLLFSLSLAGADAYASLFVGMGLLIHSLLPFVYGIQLESNCFPLALECIRVGGLIVSVLHLLLLAFNHYIGIIRPLHYAANMTRRNAMISIAIMWSLPTAFFFGYSASVPGQGFQSVGCQQILFIYQHDFHVMVSTLFFVPLVLMTVMYCHIFVIVRQHNRGFRERHDSRQFRKNVKAVVTTLLFMGTYYGLWMPPVLFYVLVCENCVVRHVELSRTTVFFVSFVNNALIIIKLTINPIVYAARMKDVRVALNRMVISCCPRCLMTHSRFAVNDDGTSSCMARSRTDTMATSIRMHSVYTNNKPSSSSSPPSATCRRKHLQQLSIRHNRSGRNNSNRQSNNGLLLPNSPTHILEHQSASTDH